MHNVYFIIKCKLHHPIGTACRCDLVSQKSTIDLWFDGEETFVTNDYYDYLIFHFAWNCPWPFVFSLDRVNHVYRINITGHYRGHLATMCYLDMDSAILSGSRGSIIAIARADARFTVLRSAGQDRAIRSVIIVAKMISRVLLGKQWLVSRTVELAAEFRWKSRQDRRFSRNRKTHQLY